MKVKSKFSLVVCMIFLSLQCVQLQSIAINSQPAPDERVKKILAETEKLVFLGFNFDNDFLEETPKKLMDQCKDGKIKGIITKYEIIHYFLFNKFVIKASGYCVK